MKRILQLSLIAALLTSCAVQVKTYQKPDHDFSSYKSWCWLQGCEVTYQGPHYYYDKKVVDEIANSIAFNMHEKGYLQADDSSDLMVNFFIVMKVDSAEVTHDYDGMFNGIDRFPINSYPEYEKFLKGSLIIDIIDRKNSELVWRSNAIKYLEMNPTYDRAEIWKGVNKALKKLPAQ